MVTQLSEYIRSQRPDIKGYSRRSIYNMVMFYDEYSSETFCATVEKYLNLEFVRPTTAQIEASQPTQETAVIVQTASAQLQPTSGQMPQILELTTLSNHIEILCRCKSTEERMFYILYANKEHLSFKEMQRCISNQTYTALLSSKDNMSKRITQCLPQCPYNVQRHIVCRFPELAQKT